MAKDVLNISSLTDDQQRIMNSVCNNECCVMQHNIKTDTCVMRHNIKTDTIDVFSQALSGDRYTLIGIVLSLILCVPIVYALIVLYSINPLYAIICCVILSVISSKI